MPAPGAPRCPSVPCRAGASPAPLGLRTMTCLCARGRCSCSIRVAQAMGAAVLPPGLVARPAGRRHASPGADRPAMLAPKCSCFPAAGCADAWQSFHVQRALPYRIRLLHFCATSTSCCPWHVASGPGASPPAAAACRSAAHTSWRTTRLRGAGQGGREGPAR